MHYLPSVMGTATMLHVLDSIEPCLGGEYEKQLLDILAIDKVGNLFLVILMNLEIS